MGAERIRITYRYRRGEQVGLPWVAGPCTVLRRRYVERGQHTALPMAPLHEYELADSHGHLVRDNRGECRSLEERSWINEADLLPAPKRMAAEKRA